MPPCIAVLLPSDKFPTDGRKNHILGQEFCTFWIYVKWELHIRASCSGVVLGSTGLLSQTMKSHPGSSTVLLPIALCLSKELAVLSSCSVTVLYVFVYNPVLWENFVSVECALHCPNFVLRLYTDIQFLCTFRFVRKGPEKLRWLIRDVPFSLFWY